jgi:hypothetical protein
MTRGHVCDNDLVGTWQAQNKPVMEVLRTQYEPSNENKYDFDQILPTFSKNSGRSAVFLD